MSVVGFGSGGGVYVNGKRVALPKGPIRNMRITGAGVWIDGKKYTGESTDNDDSQPQTNIVVTGCAIEKLEINDVYSEEGIRFKDSNVTNVHTENSPITVEGAIIGDASTSNGSIHCQGNIEGNATTSNGSIRANKIHGDARSGNGNVYGASGQKL